MHRSVLITLTSLALFVAPQANAATQAAKPAAKSVTKAATKRTGRPAAKAAKPAARAPRGAYTARVTSKTPLLVVLAVDHSGSTEKGTSEGNVSKAEALADAVNGNLEMMMALSSDGVHPETNQPRFKPYFKVKAIGYDHEHYSLFPNVKGSKLATAEDLAAAVVWKNAQGQVVDAHRGERMTWTEPRSGGATHTAEALRSLVPSITRFTKENPDAPAPVVVHFTDGDHSTKDPTPVAKKIMQQRTRDGNVLMFNVHVGASGSPFVFPTAKSIKALPPEMLKAATTLFNMSSPMPKGMLMRARELFPEYDIKPGARLMVYNASGALLAQLLDLGTIQNMNVAEE